MLISLGNRICISQALLYCNKHIAYLYISQALLHCNKHIAYLQTLVGGLLGCLSSTSLVLLVKIEEEIHRGPARNQTWDLIVRHLPLSHWIQQSQLISAVFFLSCLCIVLIKAWRPGSYVLAILAQRILSLFPKIIYQSIMVNHYLKKVGMLAKLSLALSACMQYPRLLKV